MKTKSSGFRWISICCYEYNLSARDHFPYQRTLAWPQTCRIEISKARRNRENRERWISMVYANGLPFLKLINRRSRSYVLIYQLCSISIVALASDPIRSEAQRVGRAPAPETYSKKGRTQHNSAYDTVDWYNHLPECFLLALLDGLPQHVRFGADVRQKRFKWIIRTSAPTTSPSDVAAHTHRSPVYGHPAIRD